MSTAYTIYEATTRQIAGLELEREAHLQQIHALVEERDALRAEVAMLCAEIEELRTANTDPFDLATLDKGGQP